MLATLDSPCAHKSIFYSLQAPRKKSSSAGNSGISIATGRRWEHHRAPAHGPAMRWMSADGQSRAIGGDGAAIGSSGVSKTHLAGGYALAISGKGRFAVADNPTHRRTMAQALGGCRSPASRDRDAEFTADDDALAAPGRAKKMLLGEHKGEAERPLTCRETLGRVAGSRGT